MNSQSERMQDLYRRWAEIEAAKRALAEDSRALFAEAKKQGFNVKALREAFRRKCDQAKGGAAREQHEADVDQYERLLADSTAVATQARDAREAAPSGDINPTSKRQPSLLSAATKPQKTELVADDEVEQCNSTASPRLQEETAGTKVADINDKTISARPGLEQGLEGGAAPVAAIGTDGPKLMSATHAPMDPRELTTGEVTEKVTRVPRAKNSRPMPPRNSDTATGNAPTLTNEHTIASPTLGAGEEPAGNRPHNIVQIDSQTAETDPMTNTTQGADRQVHAMDAPIKHKDAKQETLFSSSVRPPAHGLGEEEPEMPDFLVRK